MMIKETIQPEGVTDPVVLPFDGFAIGNGLEMLLMTKMSMSQYMSRIGIDTGDVPLSGYANLIRGFSIAAEILPLTNASPLDLTDRNLLPNGMYSQEYSLEGLTEGDAYWPLIFDLSNGDPILIQGQVSLLNSDKQVVREFDTTGRMVASGTNPIDLQLLVWRIGQAGEFEPVVAGGVFFVRVTVDASVVQAMQSGKMAAYVVLIRWSEMLQMPEPKAHLPPVPLTATEIGIGESITFNLSADSQVSAYRGSDELCGMLRLVWDTNNGDNVVVVLSSEDDRSLTLFVVDANNSVCFEGEGVGRGRMAAFSYSQYTAPYTLVALPDQRYFGAMTLSVSAPLTEPVI